MDVVTVCTFLLFDAKLIQTLIWNHSLAALKRLNPPCSRGIKANPLLLENKQQMSHIWPDLLAIITRKKTS